MIIFCLTARATTINVIIMISFIYLFFVVEFYLKLYTLVYKMRFWSRVITQWDIVQNNSIVLAYKRCVSPSIIITHLGPYAYTTGPNGCKQCTLCSDHRQLIDHIERFPKCRRYATTFSVYIGSSVTIVISIVVKLLVRNII